MNSITRLWKQLVPEPYRRRIYHVRQQIYTNRSNTQQAELQPIRSEHSLTPVVSIIVPVYKVEAYLGACVDSLLAQSFKNLEIILVDDGSPDRCGDICESYAKKYSQVTVRHQQNGGLSNARNNGLRRATGAYVMFVDSDDIVPPDAVQELLRGIEEHSADIATGNVKRFKGSREWQSWNQMYSHTQPRTWDGREAAEASKLTSLQLAPELLFDTTAWNKLFSRRFFLESGVLFPESKLYEDMLPMAQLFIAARGIVKVPGVVYLYREREDNSSITQKRGQLVNLADKMEMVGRIYNVLIGSGANREQLDTLCFKVLEGDLAVYSPHLGDDHEFDRLYLTELQKYWDLSSQAARSALALDRRSLYVNQLYTRDPLAGEMEAAWVSDNFYTIPLIMVNGILQADSNWCPEHLLLLDEHRLLDMSRYVNLKQVITDAFIDAGFLRIRGFAFLDYLPESCVQEVRVSLHSVSGENIELPVVASNDSRANGYWGSGNADRSSTGFEVNVSVEQLFLNSTGAFDETDEYTIVVGVRAGEYERTMAATGYWRGGRIRLGEVSALQSGELVSLPWQPWGKPLRIQVKRPRFVMRNLSMSGNLMTIGFSSQTGEKADTVRAVRSWDGHTISMYPVAGDSQTSFQYAAVLTDAPNRRHAGGNSNVWRFEALSASSQSWEKIASSVDGSKVRIVGPRWSTRTNSDATALLHDECSTLLVDSISQTSRGYRLSGFGDLDGDEAFLVEMWSERGAVHTSTSISTFASGRFELVVNCATGEDGRDVVAWEPGEYRIRLSQAGDTGCVYRIRANASVVKDCPVENQTPFYRGRWHVISDTWELALGIAPPLSNEERGRYNDLRMRERWARKGDSEVRHLDAVVFSVDMGSSVADSQLAILNEMRNRGLPYEYRWAVTDHSVSAPAGAQPLLRGSEEWYEYLSCAKLVVNNYGGIAGYGNRGHQSYLQTWHGTPLKYVGNSEFKSHPREYAKRKLVAQRESQEWDWFLSQSPFMTELIRSEFYYTGEVIETGYPRNDALAHGDEASRDALKGALGVSLETKVLLYAPTFRDVSAQGFKSPFVDNLDLERLSNRLGDDWVVILRGHSFNARSDDKNRSGAAIIDLTRHPDVNDLILVSDVLVTDYSSIMFDYMVTDRPIVYFVPDLEEYLANRGMYFDYEDVLVGEVAKSEDDLARLVDLATDQTMIDAHASAYSRQKQRFVPWDDGEAASRVVDKILLEQKNGASQ